MFRVRVCFLAIRLFMHCFPCVFLPQSVVEAAPQARLKTTPASITALGPCFFSSSPFNTLPVAFLRQVSPLVMNRMKLIADELASVEAAAHMAIEQDQPFS